MNKKDFYSLYQNFLYFISFRILEKLTIREIIFRSYGGGRKREETKNDEREVGGINDIRDKRFQGNRETNDNSLISSPIFFLDRTYAQDKLFVSG